MDKIPLPKVVLEIGINHQGQRSIAIQAIHAVMGVAGDYPRDRIFFKFQKRIPTLEVPKHMWEKERVHPFSGRTMDYITYKDAMEFWNTDFDKIWNACNAHGVRWFTSVWGMDSLYWMIENYPDVPYIKIPSALANDRNLLIELYTLAEEFQFTAIVSTGGLAELQMDSIYQLSQRDSYMLACTSTYPTPMDEVNLTRIPTMRERFPALRIGYSSHSKSPLVPVASYIVGAEMVEFHITLDRAMRGSDHAASIEIPGVGRILRDLIEVQKMLGDGTLVPSPSELEKLETLKG